MSHVNTPAEPLVGEFFHREGMKNAKRLMGAKPSFAKSKDISRTSPLRGENASNLTAHGG
jgi:hypothetical protein